MDTIARDERGLAEGRFMLGSLCARRHDWKGTGKSLRRNRGAKSDCVPCNREMQKKKQPPLKRVPLDHPSRQLLPGKPYSQLDVDRFWGHVIKSEDPDMCWSWKGWTVEEYGMVYIQGKDVRGPRFSWELHNGRSIPDGLEIMHDCDNPPCTNPKHIKAVTHAENIADRDRKGHTAKGERHYSRTKPESILRGEKHWSRRKGTI